MLRSWPMPGRPLEFGAMLMSCGSRRRDVVGDRAGSRFLLSEWMVPVAQVSLGFVSEAPNRLDVMEAADSSTSSEVMLFLDGGDLFVTGESSSIDLVLKRFAGTGQLNAPWVGNEIGEAGARGCGSRYARRDAR